MFDWKALHYDPSIPTMNPNPLNLDEARIEIFDSNNKPIATYFHSTDSVVFAPGQSGESVIKMLYREHIDKVNASISLLKQERKV